MGDGIWFLDDTPSERFPQYCRGNVGEVVPDVATPLASTMLTSAFRRAFSKVFVESGGFHAEELVEGSATGGTFGGYLYINLSFARVFARRTPGLRLRDIDQQLLGSSPAPPYRADTRDRSASRSLRVVTGLPRSFLRREPSDLAADRAATRAWLEALPPHPSDEELVELVRTYDERFERMLTALLDATMASALPMSLLERLSKRAERAEPGVLVKALSGIGTIETAAPAAALWSLGRLVAASPSLSAVFDAGDHDLLARLRAAAADPDVAGFLDAFTAFTAEHGHRGPNELELSSETWSTAPASALAAVDRLRLAPAAADPAAAATRLAAEREQATRRLHRSARLPLRPVVDRLLTAAARGAARREQAKGTIVLDLSGMRRVLFDRADALVARGALPDRKALFMVTADELADLLRAPASMSDRIAARRQRYDELNARIPPFAFEGEMPPPSTWPRRGGVAADPAPPGTVLSGIGVSSGASEGTVRVITDPADPRGIEPGDVLVAPITDPAWTPLFLAATAVVVDVGALQSHAAIVARELGIPAVVSVSDATARLVDGMRIAVDGDRGTVRVLDGCA